MLPKYLRVKDSGLYTYDDLTIEEVKKFITEYHLRSIASVADISELDYDPAILGYIWDDGGSWLPVVVGSYDECLVLQEKDGGPKYWLLPTDFEPFENTIAFVEFEARPAMPNRQYLKALNVLSVIDMES